MKTVPDEYPAHETLWRFAIIWTVVACIAAPLIIGYILKKPFDPNQILVSNDTLERIYARSDKEVMFGMKIAFCIAPVLWLSLCACHRETDCRCPLL